MKILPLFFAGFLCTATCFAELSTDAQRAYLRGDFVTAKRDFELLLKLDPSNKVAGNYLRMIRVEEERAGGGGELEAKLQAIVLPKVEFKDTTFSEVLESLRQQTSKVSDGKVAPNFVLQVPTESAQKSVTLNLSNVPLLEVLKYVGQLTGTTFLVDKYAVVVKPSGEATAATGAESPTAIQ